MVSIEVTATKPDEMREVLGLLFEKRRDGMQPAAPESGLSALARKAVGAEPTSSASRDSDGA